MKNFTLISLVATALLFTACGEKTKEAATEAASAVTEAVKEDASSIAEATKKIATDAVESTKAKASEVKAATEAKAAEATNALKERATKAQEAVSKAVAPDNAVGKAAYASCIGCHGADGTTIALGKGVPVAGQTAEALEEALHGYKAGTRNVSGMGMLMKGQVASMDDATIKAVSEYMSGL